MKLFDQTINNKMNIVKSINFNYLFKLLKLKSITSFAYVIFMFKIFEINFVKLKFFKLNIQRKKKRKKTIEITFRIRISNFQKFRRL